MNKEELMQFVEWLPNNVEEFKGMDPDQIVNTLNKLSESEEGISQLNELMGAYKKSKQMFRKGGKIEYLVSKYQNGGVYDRRAGRQEKRNRGVSEDLEGRTRSNQILAKKAKAAHVDGFNENMFNFDPDAEFDRSIYRNRKRMARDINPEWTRRQRKAYALSTGPRDVELAQMPGIPKRKVPLPDYVVPGGKAWVEVGIPEAEEIWIDPIPQPDPEPPVVPENSNIPTPAWSFNQFAGRLDDYINRSKAIKTGSDTRAFQVWRAKEYARYAQDPENYRYQQMPSNFRATTQDLAKYSGFLANNRGAGYYDPADTRYDAAFKQGVDEIRRDKFSDAMSNLALGSAVTPALMVAASQIPTGAVRETLKEGIDAAAQSMYQRPHLVQRTRDLKGRFSGVGNGWDIGHHVAEVYKPGASVSTMGNNLVGRTFGTGLLKKGGKIK